MSFAGRSKDQDLIDDLARWLNAPDPETTKTNGHAKVRPLAAAPTVDDEKIIQKCRDAKNAAKFEALFDRGDVHAYHGGDDSGADLSLLDILKFWTQDEVQLERIFSASALGCRDKWLRRDDYRKRTIHKALSDVGKVYDWGPQRSRPLSRSEVNFADLPYIGKSTKSTDDEGPKLSLVRFADRPAPKPREFIVSDLIPRHHPTTLYGWGGTAKSLLAVLLGLNVAGGKEEFFGRSVSVHAPVLYLDFELDADEQHRRVVQLASGMNMAIPQDFFYVSTLGFRTHEAIEFALSACRDHGMVMVVLDSLGPAMTGDMTAARDVIEFHNRYIAPFKALGVTPILVDHQARQANGEGYQSKGAFGSAYKEHLSRSLVQVEAGDRNGDKGTLNVRLRHKKTNFGRLVEPFDVSLSFSEETIVATTRILTPADRAQEATLNASDRVLAALEDGPAFPDEIVEATGLARSTVKNNINTHKKAGRVEITGEIRNQMEQVRLVDSRSRPIKEKSTKSTPKDPGRGPTLIPDEDGPTTVAGLFANTPGWLASQLKIYRQNPDLHFKPLCTAVAAAVLGGDARAEDVADEVRREVGD